MLVIACYAGSVVADVSPSLSFAAVYSDDSHDVFETELSEEAVYREALYHYFLRDYAGAFSVLGQHAKVSTVDVPGGTTSRRIQRLTAGVALAYGMHDMARRLLLVLLDDPQQRDVANYYLALLAYRQGDPLQSKHHLNAIKALPKQLVAAHDVALLQADIALQLADPAWASMALDKLTKGSRDYLLTALNIANYYSRQGDFSHAREYYRKLDDAKQDDRRWLTDWHWPTLGWRKDNSHSVLAATARTTFNPNVGVDSIVAAESMKQDNERLVNRARLAAGYAALDAGLASEAERWLMAIPQDSAGARQAVLGYGWSQYQRGDFTRALGAWEALPSSPQLAALPSALLFTQTIEASLGVAMIYAMLSRPRMALNQYQHLAADLESHLSSISELLVKDRLLVEDEALMQHYLHSWQESDAFALQMDRRSELHGLALQAQNWLDKLDVYAAALRDKDQLRQQQAGLLTNAGFNQRVDDLDQQHQLLSVKLDIIKLNQDPASVATAAQHKLRQRVVKARTNWQSLVDARARLTASNAQETGDNKETNDNNNAVDLLVPSVERLEHANQALRLYQGVLDWDASKGWHDALWQLEKRRSQTAASVAAARARQASIAQLLSDSSDIVPLLAQIQTRQSDLLALRSQLNHHILTINTGLLAAQRSALLTQQDVARSQMAQIHFNMGAAYDQSTRIKSTAPIDDGVSQR